MGRLFYGNRKRSASFRFRQVAYLRRPLFPIVMTQREETTRRSYGDKCRSKSGDHPKGNPAYEEDDSQRQSNRAPRKKNEGSHGLPSARPLTRVSTPISSLNDSASPSP